MYCQLAGAEQGRWLLLYRLSTFRLQLQLRLQLSLRWAQRMHRQAVLM